MNLHMNPPDLAAAADAPLDRSAETVLLDTGTYGPLHVTARPHLDTGALGCRVTASRATGTFTLAPVFGNDHVDPDTTRLIVHYGGELPPDSSKPGDRRDRPVINGTVTLIDYSIIDAARGLAGARTLYELGAVIWRHDPSVGRHRVPVPNRTARRVGAILAVHWLQRPDVDQLRRPAARHALRNGHHIQRKREAIAKAEADIAAKQLALADDRAQLAHMLHLLHGLDPATHRSARRL